MEPCTIYTSRCHPCPAPVSVFSPHQLLHLTHTSHGFFSLVSSDTCLFLHYQVSKKWQDKTRKSCCFSFPTHAQFTLGWWQRWRVELNLPFTTGTHCSKTPPPPTPTMGSHETGRCSSRLVATAALVWDPGGEVVEGEARMRDELPGFLWSPRNAENREGKGWRCGSKTEPKIYVPGKILESCLTDSLN